MTTTLVSVNAYTYSVAFVADKILASLKRVILCSGLDPSKLAGDWLALDKGIKTWLGSRHLVRVILEVLDQESDKLVGRWDFDVSYSLDYGDDGAFWVDTEAIKYTINKCRLLPSECSYRIVVTTKPGSPDVRGWTSTALRSTDGFQRHSIGTTIGANPLASRLAYWRRSP